MSDLYAAVPSPGVPSFAPPECLGDAEVERRLGDFEDLAGLRKTSDNSPRLYQYQTVSDARCSTHGC